MLHRAREFSSMSPAGDETAAVTAHAARGAGIPGALKRCKRKTARG